MRCAIQWCFGVRLAHRLASSSTNETHHARQPTSPGRRMRSTPRGGRGKRDDSSRECMRRQGRTRHRGGIDRTGGWPPPGTCASPTADDCSGGGRRGRGRRCRRRRHGRCSRGWRRRTSNWRREGGTTTVGPRTGGSWTCATSARAGAANKIERNKLVMQ